MLMFYFYKKLIKIFLLLLCIIFYRIIFPCDELSFTLDLSHFHDEIYKRYLYYNQFIYILLNIKKLISIKNLNKKKY